MLWVTGAYRGKFQKRRSFIARKSQQCNFIIILFFQTTDRRTLGYECNFCYEPIATFLSLSTHVKFHRQRYCKMCYWILRENEIMEQHIANYHRIRPEITTTCSP